MSTLVILLLVVAGLVIIHYFHSLGQESSKKNIADYLKRKRRKKTDQDKRDMSDDINDGLDSLMPNYDYQDTTIARLIIGLFNLILIPLRMINDAFTWLICTLRQVIIDAKDTIKQQFKTDTIDEANTKGDGQAGDLARGFMLSFIVLIVLVVLTVANYEILRIGLPVIWPADKTPVANIFGMDVYVINILAILMIIAEFTLSLLAHEFRSDRSRFTEKSRAMTVIMYVFLVALCLSEAALAVYRTQYMGGSRYINDLPLWAIGFISFIVPLIAALCFEYMSGYLIWMLAGILLIIVYILRLPFLLAEMIVTRLLELALYLLDILSAPFRIIHQAATGTAHWFFPYRKTPRISQADDKALPTERGRCT